MADPIKLNLDTPMINPNSGKPVRLVSTATALELGIKSDLEIEERINEFPESVLGNVIVSLFEVTPMPSNTLFSIYNEITIDIRKARQKGESHIEITKDSLEQFKKLFTDNPPKDPKDNRNVGFVLECIEMTLAKSVVEPIPEN